MFICRVVTNGVGILGCGSFRFSVGGDISLGFFQLELWFRDLREVILILRLVFRVIVVFFGEFRGIGFYFGIGLFFVFREFLV